MRGRTQSPPGARVGAGGLRGRTHHWRLDISPGWFATGGQRRASRQTGVARKSAWVRPISYIERKKSIFGGLSRRSFNPFVSCGGPVVRFNTPPKL
eukprot:scaffold48526_cov42-Phaeocystis_antarctica.AAC.1